jgi:hypothetical protein
MQTALKTLMVMHRLMRECDATFLNGVSPVTSWMPTIASCSCSHIREAVRVNPDDPLAQAPQCIKESGICVVQCTTRRKLTPDHIDGRRLGF